MSRFLRGLSLVLAAAAFIAAPLAQASTTTPLLSHEKYTVGKGDLETIFNGTPFIIRGGGAHTNFFQMNVGANYFITDYLAPGLEVDVLKSGGTFFRFLPNAKAYWPGLGRLLPYAQLGLGYAHAAGDKFDLRIGPGVDFMLANNVAVGLAFQYDALIGSNTNHWISFPFGFNIYFKI